MQPKIISKQKGPRKGGEVLRESDGMFAVVIRGATGRRVHKRFSDELAARMCLEHAVRSPY